MSPSISIIIPVYNGASTLEECVHAILLQTYLHFEVIIINDGSSDGTYEICEELLEEDQRVKVFHQKNAGVSSARNLGLKNASGEFIVFCDADDKIDNVLYLEKLMEYKDADVVLSSFRTIPEDILTSFPNQEFDTTAEIGACLEKYIYTGFSMPWCKIFKRSIVVDNNLSFDINLSTGEDTLWVYKYLRHVRKVRVCEIDGYIYRKDLGTLSKISISKPTLERTLGLIIEVLEQLESIFHCVLVEWKLNITMYFYHRYIITLSNAALVDIMSELKKHDDYDLLHSIFEDKIYVLKGIRLKTFNFFMRSKMYFFLACYVKICKRYL